MNKRLNQRHAQLRALVERKILAYLNGYEGLPGWKTIGVTESANEIIELVRRYSIPEDLPSLDKEEQA